MIDFTHPIGREFLLMVERAKFERFVVGEIDEILQQTFTRVVDQMVSPDFRFLTRDQQARTIQLFREIEAVIRGGYATATRRAIEHAQGYASLEVEIAKAQMIGTTASAPPSVRASVAAFVPRQLVISVAAFPVQGLQIGEWFEGQARQMSLDTRRTIQGALLEGKSPADITRRVLSLRPVGDPAVSRRARRDAAAVVRTTVNSVQNHASQESFKAAGSGITDRYRYLAVRDSRTSAVCRALDGRVFRYDDPKRKEPPQHLQCRSTTVPVLRGVSAGELPTMRTYDGWLKAQSKGVQNDALGPTRADLWRSGRMTLGDAVDEDGRTLTLKQLAERLGLERGAAALLPAS